MTDKIVVATDEEQYQLALMIRKRVFVDEQRVPFEIEVDEYEHSSINFLYLRQDVPVATGRLRKKEELIKFERIATLREYRGQNIGAGLMAGMQNYAAKHFPDLLPYMHAQTSANGFYKKLGWTQIGSNFSEADIDHFAMILVGEDGIGADLRRRLEAMPDLPFPLGEYLGLRS